MKEPFGRVVFSVAGAEYRWEDVVLAAELSGEWSLVRDRARQGIACLTALDLEKLTLEDAELESAANEFRYDRDLISAEEMEEWLARWGLTAEGWMDYIRSSLLRPRWSGELAEAVSEPSYSDDDFQDRILAEAVCSGELQRLAVALAGKAAVVAREAEDPAKPGPAYDAPLPVELPAPPTLPGIPVEMALAKMENLARLDRSFRRACERTATSEVVMARIRANQADWTRLECQSVSFPREEAAREVALCVRDDGMALEDAAGEANREVRLEEIYIEDVDPDLRGLFLTAQKGELIGPVKGGEGFLLYLVLDKVLPSEADESVVARARDAVVKRLVEAEMNDRVKWHWRF